MADLGGDLKIILSLFDVGNVQVLVNAPSRVLYENNYLARGSSRRSCSMRRSLVLHECPVVIVTFR